MDIHQISDQELIELIKDDSDYLGVIYKRCYDYCIMFMHKVKGSNNSFDTDLDEVFNDAVMVLYEKILEGNFKLTASIQTYLSSVCRFQLLNRFKKNKQNISLEDFDNNGEHLQFDGAVTDTLVDVEAENEEQFKAMENALTEMKNAGGKCYELLTLFWYHKKSMKELSEIFGYTNPANAKNQKAKCQKRLEKLAFNYLNA
ncbi:RNA polymerase sigma factor, sigma-70 family [Galbibacter orientalis DSM 19592]|uniref:RNA polymerase sigma factor, sigma-70 family n=1 Tax=Galbibacter orientalis DSM 19592 TaxID=926559 RepID=I3C597_9FLAO|nr:sigma-70 family RNA polymerase sigma factor [Galbibacter orientalis]EIJ38790.1 RNA polymerase sigma factor, sigma-70 family [Galbibacter orientalis DSM 19592]